MAASQHILVPTFGRGGVDELSKHVVGDTRPCWALLRHEVESESATREVIVKVAIHDPDTSASECENGLSPYMFHALGNVDVTLKLSDGQALHEELRAALELGRCHENWFVADDGAKVIDGELGVEGALNGVGKDLASYNWALLEPTSLSLHKAGFGGLEEMKDCLPQDKVLFGVLRFAFPREDSAPPIIKHLFIHWIGQKVSVVRRGQWNSKLEDAASSIRKACDFAFRKTAYGLEDLELPQLISELARVTCATSSDTRQLSVDWYLEGLHHARQEAPVLQAAHAIHTENSRTNVAEKNLKFLLPESAKHAINKVREAGSQWDWVHLRLAEGKAPSSGGA